jgi:hypothetical protein
MNMYFLIESSYNLRVSGGNENSINNVGLFTSEEPIAGSDFAVSGEKYKIYTSHKDVEVDFGTTSDTYKMAYAMYNQEFNIRTGGGALYVILVDTASSDIQTELADTSDLDYYLCTTNIALTSDELQSVASAVQSSNRRSFVYSIREQDTEANTITLVDEIKTKIFDNDYTYTEVVYSNVDEANEKLLRAALVSTYAGVNTSKVNNGKYNLQAKTLKGVATLGIKKESYFALITTRGVSVFGNSSPTIGNSIRLSSVNGGAFLEKRELHAISLAIDTALYNLITTTRNIEISDSGIRLLTGKIKEILTVFRSNQVITSGIEYDDIILFGNSADFKENIYSQGFYVQADSVSSLSSADRAAGKTPEIRYAYRTSVGVKHITISGNATV